MGKRGPAPTPTALLKARGSWRGASRPGEPQPKVGEPPKPAGLSKVASTAWDILAPRLAIVRCLAETDGIALARYCELWAAFASLRTRRTRKPDDVNLLYAMLKAGETMLRLEREFGLTPAARAQLTVGPADVDDDRPNYFGPARVMG